MKLFLFAGEKSGDLHGSHLIKALKAFHPHWEFEGVGGPKMRSEGCQCVLQMEDFEVMGISDVILSFPKILKQFHLLKNFILKQKPDCIVLIDYPGFNLRLAKALRKNGFKGKLVQYISPTVWAHGKKRIKHMEETLDLLLTIYPFESACFKESPLIVDYVGNPIDEYIRQYTYREDWHKTLGIPNKNNLIAIFPGSREGEIKRNLKFLLDSAQMMKKVHPESFFGISCAHSETMLTLNQIPKNDHIFLIPSEYTYELMRDSRCALAKSGTVTLELALHQCPTVVVYHLSGINRFYAKHILRLNLPHYCIVNILSGKRVFPEFIEKEMSPQSIFKELSSLYSEGNERTSCLQECLQIRQMFNGFHASKQAALYIKMLLSC